MASRLTARWEPGNKYTISLNSLKESTHFRFRARGEDYFTPPKRSPSSPPRTRQDITIDKEEPAYIYHRLLGVDQSALARPEARHAKMPALDHRRHQHVEVPLGSNLVIHVKTDRKLHADKSVVTAGKTRSLLDPGFDNYPRQTAVIDADRAASRSS